MTPDTRLRALIENAVLDSETGDGGTAGMAQALREILDRVTDPASRAEVERIVERNLGGLADSMPSAAECDRVPRFAALREFTQPE